MIRFGLPGGIYILRNFETDFVANPAVNMRGHVSPLPLRKDGTVLNSVERLLHRIIKSSCWNSVFVFFLSVSSLQLSHLLRTSNINLDKLRKIAPSSR